MHASSDSSPNISSSASHFPDADPILNELAQLKRQLLQAEVRRAKARAMTSGAEADIKVLNSRLRALTR